MLHQNPSKRFLFLGTMNRRDQVPQSSISAGNIKSTYNRCMAMDCRELQCIHCLGVKTLVLRQGRITTHVLA